MATTTRRSSDPDRARTQGRRVFDPILRAKRSGSDRERLQEVQAKTRTEQARFHHYPNAGVVRRMFRDDVHAAAGRGPARRVNDKLAQLGLPRLRDVASEFYRRADALGVTEARERRTPHRAHRPHPQHEKSPTSRAAAGGATPSGKRHASPRTATRSRATRT